MPKKLSLVCAFYFLFSAAAHATIVFTPSITFLEQKVTEEDQISRNGKLTVIDVRLGYITDFGLYVGGLYSIQDQDLLSDASDSYFGPSVGYSRGGFLFVGTYYLYGERDLTNGSLKYSDVSGFQLDFSYAVPVFENFSVGPQLTYYSVKFDSAEESGISRSTNYKTSGITPYFNLTFTFL